MKERNRNGANERTSIERQKNGQTDLQYSKDDIGYRIFPDVPNKDTFDPPKFTHFNKQEHRGNMRLSPLDTLGVLI